MNEIELLLRKKKHLLHMAFHHWSGRRMVVPRRWLTSQEYARRFSARWHQVYGQTSIERNPPVCHGRRVADFEWMLESAFPDFGVLELNKGYLVGPHGWVVSRDGYLLPDHSWHGVHIADTRIPKRIYSCVRLKGVCLSLASDWTSIYWHFLLQGLTRLDLFRRAGFALSNVDFFYISGLPDEHSGRMLVKLGIPPEKCVVATKEVAVQADVVLAASFPGIRWNYPKWGVDFLRRAFTPSPVTPELRLYIPRTTTRRIINEQILIEILNQHGFQVFDPPQHDDPFNYFARAAIVVGGTGSGFANLAFCQPGTKVLELIPSDQVSASVYALSEAAGLHYAYLIGESTSVRPLSRSGRSPYDYRIDEEEFRNALTQTINMGNGTERINSAQVSAMSVDKL
jgi:hypothetical protein